MKTPVVFECGTEYLVGIIHNPGKPKSKGVVVVVGGPQYRVGSHRQFVLLSEHMAVEGFSSLRFDYQGMGDSSGEKKDFENVDNDIRCAIDALINSCPEITEIVLWGLCDAASAILFYAYKDSRVTGIVLLNPWVRTEEGESRAFLKHYYLKKFFIVETWKDLFLGRLNIFNSMMSLLKNFKNAYLRNTKYNSNSETQISLPDRMLYGYENFEGESLIIISGDDLTAAEFVDVSQSSIKWRECMASKKLTWKLLDEANHTFSSKKMRDQVSLWTTNWLGSW